MDSDKREPSSSWSVSESNEIGSTLLLLLKKRAETRLGTQWRFGTITHALVVHISSKEMRRRRAMIQYDDNHSELVTQQWLQAQQQLAIYFLTREKKPFSGSDVIVFRTAIALSQSQLSLRLATKRIPTF
jgi:ribosomal protein L14